MPVWWRLCFSWGLFTSQVSQVCVILKLVRTTLSSHFHLHFFLLLFRVLFLSQFNSVLSWSSPCFSSGYHAERAHPHGHSALFDKAYHWKQQRQEIFTRGLKPERGSYLPPVSAIRIRNVMEYFLKPGLEKYQHIIGSLTTWYEHRRLSVELSWEKALPMPWSPVQVEDSHARVLYSQHQHSKAV